jgi:hypothetical protein
MAHDSAIVVISFAITVSAPRAEFGMECKITCLELGVGPAGNLNNHVDDALLLVGKEGNVVEGRDDLVLVVFWGSARG